MLRVINSDDPYFTETEQSDKEGKWRSLNRLATISLISLSVDITLVGAGRHVNNMWITSGGSNFVSGTFPIIFIVTYKPITTLITITLIK